MREIAIDADELVKLTLALCNVESPAGREVSGEPAGICNCMNIPLTDKDGG